LIEKDFYPSPLIMDEWRGRNESPCSKAKSQQGSLRKDILSKFNGNGTFSASRLSSLNGRANHRRDGFHAPRILPNRQYEGRHASKTHSGKVWFSTGGSDSETDPAPVVDGRGTGYPCLFLQLEETRNLSAVCLVWHNIRAMGAVLRFHSHVDTIFLVLSIKRSPHIIRACSH
jgi:hypothetical protein